MTPFFFLIGGRLNRPRDRCRLTVSCAFKLWIFLRLKLPTRERLFPCTGCYGASPSVRGMGESVRYVKSTDSNRGGISSAIYSAYRVGATPPLTNRRSVVAVD